MSRVLITGAAGFIGSHTADLLLQEGHTVVGLDNFRTGQPGNLSVARGHERFRFVEGDFTDGPALARLLGEFRPDAVIHLAAMVSVPESIARPEENDRLNRRGTRLVAEAARAAGVRRMVFASSAAVYGLCPDLPLQEASAGHPISPYGEAKWDSEAILLSAFPESAPDLVARCHRYFNVYGPRQDPTSPYSGVISRFAAALRAGTAPTILGDGGQTRDFIYVGDVARANVIAATAPDLRSGVANICTGQAVSLNELWQTLRALCGSNLEALSGPARAGDIRHSVGAPGRALAELGFTARTSLEAGLRALMAS